MNQAIRWLLCGMCFCAVVSADTPGVLAIRNARIVTAAGPVIEKGTVVVRDGLIEAAEANAAVPADAWVIEGAQLTVYPGLIDALSTWGIPSAAPAPAAPSGRGGAGSAQAAQSPRSRGPEDRPSNTSWLAAQDLVRADDRSIAAARSAGFTTAVTYPASGIFGGNGAAINLGGGKAGHMVVSSGTGLYLSASIRGNSGYPNSLLGVYAYMRQIFLDADAYRAEKEAYAANARGRKRPDYDRALEGVLDSPRILLPASRAVEIERMIRFAAEWKRPAVLYGGHEAYRSAGLLKRSNTPMLVSLRWPERERDADPEAEESLRILESREKAPSAPAALAKAGVKFAFYSGGVERPADLRRAAKQAIDAGLSPADALRALTLSAAEIYGLADRIGSIEKGKIANLVVTDGDLFATGTRIKYVLVDGVKYEPAPESTEPAREEAR